MTGNTRSIWTRWGGGFLASCIFIWAVSAVFLPRILPLTLDPDLGEYIPAPGSSTTSMKEGWGTTHYGPHRIIGPEQWEQSGQAVFFWGDSHLEALHLDDRDKIPAVFTRACRNAGMELTGLNLGRGGHSVADYAFLIPAMERILGTPAAHVILLAATRDITPGKQEQCHSKLLALPRPALEFSRCDPSPLALRATPLLHALHLQLAFELYSRCSTLDLRFLPGGLPNGNRAPAKRKKPHGATSVDITAAQAFLLDELRQRTTAPIVFVYCPKVPTLSKGQIFKQDTRAETIQKFASLCRERDIALINMTTAFNSYYEQHGTLLHGSANGIPGKGHLNGRAHALIAGELQRYFQDSEDALHAD